MQEMLCSDLKLNFLKKKTSDNKDEDIQGQLLRAQCKWERLTHFMLNIDHMQYRDAYPEEANLDAILMAMGFSLNAQQLSLRDK